jgi:hypothetical protein
MKVNLKISLAALLGLFLIQSIAWVKGNENFHTYKVEENLNPLDAKKEMGSNYKSGKVYFYKSIVVETISTSGFPLVFSTKVDTVSNELMSKTRHSH